MLQLVQGAVEGALKAGFVTTQGVDEFGAVPIVAIDLGFVVESVAGAFAVFAEVRVAVAVVARFDAADAAQAPSGRHDLLHQDRFDLRQRIEVFADGLGVTEQLLLLFEGSEELARHEPVGTGVLRGAGFALRRARSCAVLRIAAVGRDLFFTWHEKALICYEFCRRVVRESARGSVSS